MKTKIDMNDFEQIPFVVSYQVSRYSSLSKRAGSAVNLHSLHSITPLLVILKYCSGKQVQVASDLEFLVADFSDSAWCVFAFSLSVYWVNGFHSQ